MKFIDI